jgi:hypothetical protein
MNNETNSDYGKEEVRNMALFVIDIISMRERFEAEKILTSYMLKYPDALRRILNEIISIEEIELSWNSLRDAGYLHYFRLCLSSLIKYHFGLIQYINYTEQFPEEVFTAYLQSRDIISDELGRLNTEGECSQKEIIRILNYCLHLPKRLSLGHERRWRILDIFPIIDSEKFSCLMGAIETEEIYKRSSGDEELFEAMETVESCLHIWEPFPPLIQEVIDRETKAAIKNCAGPKEFILQVKKRIPLIPKYGIMPRNGLRAALPDMDSEEMEKLGKAMLENSNRHRDANIKYVSSKAVYKANNFSKHYFEWNDF